jgi:O-acetyl-ADP-ribose deacetylase (regulator of RNase III)
MVQLRRGDILQAGAEALVNTVNCVGVMGRGIALEFRKAFPANFDVYEAACERKEARPGRMLTYETGLLTGPRYIINFPTKRHWNGMSRIEAASDRSREVALARRTCQRNSSGTGQEPA